MPQQLKLNSLLNCLLRLEEEPVYGDSKEATCYNAFLMTSLLLLTVRAMMLG